MASLLEYFVKDGAQNLTSHETWPLKDAEGVNLGEVIARLHFDFDANAKYISFFVPEMPGADSPENLLLNEVAGILRWSETKVGVQMALATNVVMLVSSLSLGGYISTRTGRSATRTRPNSTQEPRMPGKR